MAGVVPLNLRSSTTGLLGVLWVLRSILAVPRTALFWTEFSRTLFQVSVGDTSPGWGSLPLMLLSPQALLLQYLPGFPQLFLQPLAFLQFLLPNSDIISDSYIDQNPLLFIQDHKVWW